MLLTPTELSRQQPTNAWFCLRAQPKREHIAAACLRQTCEVEIFCPRLRFRKLTSRGAVWFIEAMFPGYLFARFDYANCHRRVKQGPGISGFVKFGERLALLPEALVNEIKRQTAGDEVVEINPALEPGSTVQVAHGPFHGLEAVVTRLIPARDRVEILIEWMGRNLYAEASASHLLPLVDIRRI
jgi:transcriptional antiterminator RfaH